MTISIRLSDEEAMLIKKYAEINDLTISELVRQSVIDRIHDEHDLRLYEQAMNELLADPTTYTLGDVEKELGLV